VATEQMARAALAETLQYELECERANSARLSAENEATFMELQKQQSVVVQLDQTSRSIIAELRDVCAEAYVRLDAALTAVEHEREQLIRQQRQSYKMVAAMRATRAELDALLERNSSDVARSLSEALLLLSSSRTHSSTITRDAGCVTDLTIAELEAYRLRRQEKHEVRRKARRIQHMEEMRKRGAGPVDHYAVTLEGELAALERRARLAQQAALTAATTGSSPQQIPTSPKGSVASTTTSTSATKRGPPASDAGVDDDMSMVLIDADDEDLVDPAFQQMTEDRWMDEKLVSDCCGCEKPFRLLKRKHHCRRCGCVFCDKCCPVSNLHKIRICVQCLHPEAKYSVPPPSTRGSVSSRR
jgi:hypothetical protein